MPKVNSLLLLSFLIFLSLAKATTKNILSSYFENELKNKPIATYKIPEKDASVSVNISKATNFNWDKAAIFGRTDYKSRVCFILQLDKNECDKEDFDKMAKSESYFIVFAYEHKVVYKELFNDELLLFGRNTIGNVITPDKAAVSIYRDMTKKIRHDQTKHRQYAYYSSLVICPIIGFLFGLRFLKTSFVLGTIFILPEVLLILLMDTAYGNPVGTAMLAMYTTPAFLAGLGMCVGATFSKIKNRK